AAAIRRRTGHGSGPRAHGRPSASTTAPAIWVGLGPQPAGGLAVGRRGQPHRASSGSIGGPARADDDPRVTPDRTRYRTGDPEIDERLNELLDALDVRENRDQL